MLERLVIHSFAIIDDLTLEFGPGLNAVTGETGAGKSILVDALGSVLGERVTSDLVRTGAMRATIDAEFQIPSDLAGLIAKSLDAAGIENGGDHLLLTREIQATGRSSARINGRPVTATLLSSIGDALVDIHGQSDHLSLLKANRQREIVDAFGVDPELLGTMRQAVGDWRSARRALDNLIEHSRETAQRVDLLRYQIDDIDSAAVRPGIDGQLEQEFARLSQVDRLGSEIAAALQQIDPEDNGSSLATAGAASALRSASKLVGDSAGIDSTLDPLHTQLDEVLFLLEDVSLELKRYAGSLESNPARLEEVANSIARINELKRKYGGTIEEIIAYRESAERELVALTSSEFDEATLQDRERELLTVVNSTGAKLSEMREQSAGELTKEVQGAIEDLQLGGASLTIDVRRRSGGPDDRGTQQFTFDETGFDVVEFLFAPNEGEAPGRLRALPPAARWRGDAGAQDRYRRG